MRWMMLVALAAAACQSAPKEIPESRVDTRKSDEYDKVRPVTIALLPVKAPRADLRIGVRQEIYRILPERNYSPFKLSEVDERVDAQGRFAAEDLDWDATMEIVIDRWTPISGTDRWSATGHAVMTHKTGEVLWACDFQDYAFLVPSQSGVTDYDEAAREVAQFLVGADAGKSRLPNCPPPPADS